MTLYVDIVENGAVVVAQILGLGVRSGIRKANPHFLLSNAFLVQRGSPWLAALLVLWTWISVLALEVGALGVEDWGAGGVSART
jgi:hypothetical protein